MSEGRGLISLTADAVVIGAGIVGLATAYYLARRGFSVVVLEKSYVGSGSSTRNAGRYRVHFGNRENTEFAIRAIRKLESLSGELGWNGVFERAGYLWLARRKEVLEHYGKLNEQLWKPMGVPVQILTVDELRDRFPYINTQGIVGAIFGPQDGAFHHDYLVMGYYERSLDLGVKVFEYSEVKNIGIENGRVTSVSSGDVFVRTKNVIFTAGAWTGEVMKRTLNIDIPIKPARREIGITEPVRPLINTYVIDTETNLYVGQTMRGEILGSVELEGGEGFLPYGNTFTWLTTWARETVKLIPSLRNIRVMRIWSGYYEMTPDHSHVMGRSSTWPEGVYVLSGFSGHGFMLGPYAAELLARYIADGVVDPIMKPFLPDRFATGNLIKELLVI
ncbi:NAD(P)/FAD-dependent oxidoreductase [Vulcanisaeta souniana]|uniref:FAD-dependent oxidoreductase n=1 Tax=Vulcanisaeta souniana JCM 11219 TaxID=1293586 RepID=A0A830E6D6_9CREN|nr:FAD-binding oxidoreductase [Vulcanisaeta souniana]BDR92141.1 FAD-dependent oxidoreductase [Vulcanisaeta souniana JCM 11219]GGI67647.1 FAD-dependent oxidoreductase [Vulcanisaeta souniana JCM 11219]